MAGREGPLQHDTNDDHKADEDINVGRREVRDFREVRADGRDVRGQGEHRRDPDRDPLEPRTFVDPQRKSRHEDDKHAGHVNPKQEVEDRSREQNAAGEIRVSARRELGAIDVSAVAEQAKLGQ